MANGEREKKPTSNRVKAGFGGALGGGGTGGFGVKSIWDWLMPDNPMPAEVAIFLTAVLAAVGSFTGGWLQRGE